MIIDEEEVQKEKDSTSIITEEVGEFKDSKEMRLSQLQLSKSGHDDSSK